MGNLEKRFSDSEIIEALKNTGGAIYEAAHNLGCSAQTIYGRKKVSPAVRDAFLLLRGRLLDHCEHVVVSSALKGNVEDAKWLLTHLDRERGYRETKEGEQQSQSQALNHDNSLPLSDTERLRKLVELCDSIRARATDSLGQSEDAAANLPPQSPPEAT